VAGRTPGNLPVEESRRAGSSPDNFMLHFTVLNAKYHFEASKTTKHFSIPSFSYLKE
jgi:hypothetical protein